MLLAEINQQLTEKGLYIREGEVSIIDSSVIEAKQCRPNKRKDGTSIQDPEADWKTRCHETNRQATGLVTLPSIGVCTLDAKVLSGSSCRMHFMVPDVLFIGFFLRGVAVRFVTIS